MSRFSVIGLGKLGACLAAAIAERGHDVVGVDVDEETVAAINDGRAPVGEPGLPELVVHAGARLTATTSYLEAVLDSDVSFVVVPTPSDERGAFSLAYAARAFAEIGSALARKSSYHLVVLTSTVLPGATRFGLLPVLEERSGKSCGEGFGLCYSPEFIALGSVIRDLRNPDFTLVGESDSRAGDALEDFYSSFVANAAPCVRMSFENAELAKIALNAYVTMKISFANLLGDLCDRIPGGDVDAVSDALGRDRRVGRAYLTGGLGFGGPCFPRDNAALAFFARGVGTEAPLAEATDAANRGLPDRVVRQLCELVEPPARVAVLGLAYKPGSSVVEESQGLAIALGLAKAGFAVRAYDPLAGPGATQAANGALEVVGSMERAFEGAALIVFANDDPVFRELDVATLPPDAVIVDFWRLLADRLGGPRYIGFGRPDDRRVAAPLAELWSAAGAAEVLHGAVDH